MRVRAYDDRANLTIKAKTAGMRDAEHEYEIPLADAEELLATQCEGAKRNLHAARRATLVTVEDAGPLTVLTG